MKTLISLLTSEKLNRRYRELLTEDWSKQSIARVLRLLSDQLPVIERGNVAKGASLSQLVELLPSFVQAPANNGARGAHSD